MPLKFMEDITPTVLKFIKICKLERLLYSKKSSIRKIDIAIYCQSVLLIKD